MSASEFTGKERPISFKAPMVNAIRGDRKTQTRRLVKYPAAEGEHGWHPSGGGNFEYLPGGSARPVCPYGKPGDRLWVRESFWGCDMPGLGDQPCVVYDDEWHGKEYKPAEVRPWARKFGRIPSIHMPRDCSRILLEVVDVRVERLQEISEADAVAEGIENDPRLDPVGPCKWRHYGKPGTGVSPPSFSFRTLWESINGPDSWDSNPWVWVITFKKVNT